MSTFRLIWSHLSTSPLRGLVLARESGGLLAWDSKSTALQLDQSGRLLHLRTFPFVVLGGACTDDGSGCAVWGDGGQVWLLANDLTTRWEKRIEKGVSCVGLDSFGHRIAVADRQGTLWVFDRAGTPRAHAVVPRPLTRLAYVPERPLLVGAAEFGHVACFDDVGRSLWHDGLVAHVGSLAVDGAGNKIALACFHDGLCQYNGSGRRIRAETRPAPCRAAVISYDGQTVLAIDLERKLTFRRATTPLEMVDIGLGTAVAIALTPLAERAFVVRSDGTLLGLAITAS